MASINKTGIPAIKTFQFDSSGIGNLKNSVNLFRGDVNLTQSLISLPGPLGKKELDVNVSILYQSNIAENVLKWNLDAPTGVLGLGWDMPLEKISMNNNNSPTKETNVYYYESGGSKNQLIRELTNPFITNLDSNMEAYLANDSRLHPLLHENLVGKGINVDCNTIVSNIDDGGWVLSDEVFQRLYTIQKNNGVLELFDGGESYQLQSYQFWTIIYYPVFERWEITKETGSRYSYGGILQPIAGAKSSIGNSIEWSVRWSKVNNDGTRSALWTGNSGLTTDDGEEIQEQYATAWGLAGVQDIWGEQISYAYNEATAPDGTSTGLNGNDFEQQVGDNKGLTYTKASYLTSITDVFQHKIVFIYEDKIYDNSSDDAPKEYQDPHKETPDSTPNAFQDRYETKYMARISVINPDDDLLFFLKFDYCPVSETAASDSAVANITENTGIQYGCTFKRYLTSITQYNKDGNYLPGLKFDYYLTGEEDQTNLGALREITYPEGGVATYSYTLHDLEICQRKITITPPAEVVANGGSATPRVWFGSDYVVSVWYNYSTGQVSLQVYTWLGHWQCWQLDPANSIIAEDGSIDISTMNVMAQSNFFGIYFQQDSDTAFYLFQKDTAKSGQWLQYSDSSRDCNPITYKSNPDHLTVLGGDSFLLVLEESFDGYTLTRYTFSWSTQKWSCDTVVDNSEERIFITAQSEYFATITLNDDNTAQVTLYYLDPQLNWNQKEPVEISDFNMANEDEFVMVPGQSIIACSRLRDNNQSTSIDYSITILQWDNDYIIYKAFDEEFKDDVSFGGEPTSIVPQVIDNSLVCCAGHLIRFNGKEWLINEQLVIDSPPSNCEQRYSYSSDYALQSIYQKSYNSSQIETAKLLQFDPNTHIQDWEDSLIDLGQLTYPEFKPSEANWPSAAPDYFISGQKIYYRGASSKWSKNLQSIGNIGTDGTDDWINTGAIINSTPNYLTYTQHYDVPSQPQSPVTKILLFKNGTTISYEDLQGEQYYTSDESNSNPGLSPAGSNCFVTYPDSVVSFDKATEINLYRFAGNSIQKSIQHFAVANLSINDGFEQIHNFVFDYDLTSAACDSSGEVIKYYKSTIYPGCQNKEECPNGRIIYEYINGLILPDAGTSDDPDLYYDMLDGNLLFTTAYDNQFNFVASRSYKWKVYKAKGTSPNEEGTESLYGGFVCQTDETIIKEGITSTTSNNYEDAISGKPYSGEVISSTKNNFISAGVDETITTTNVYGYEKYSSLNVQHILNMKVQTLETIIQGDTEPVVKKGTAKTLKQWPAIKDIINVEVPAVEAMFSFMGGDVAPDFPFEDYNEGETPSGWSRKHLVCDRLDNGHITKSQSAKKLTGSVLFDKNKQLQVARFTTPGAEDRECRYLGFEVYEDCSMWEIGENTILNSTNSYIGKNSLQLQANGKLSTSLSLMDFEEDYILGFYLKTPEAFSSSADAGWTIDISVHSQRSSQFIAFEGTEGAWQYFSIPISPGEFNLNSNDTNLSIDFTANNYSSYNVLLDNIHILPIRSKFKATIYSSILHNEIGQITNGGKSTRYIHDNFGNKVIQTNNRGDVDSLTCEFFSRQGNANDLFDAEDPNCQLTIHPAHGGVCDTFTSGNEWQKRWEASNLESNWLVSEGALHHISNVSDTLTLTNSLQSTDEPDSSCFGVYCEIKSTGDSLDDNAGMTIGNDIELKWNTANSCWQLLKKGTVLTAPLVSPVKMARKWLVIRGEQTLLFYGDGQLIFSTPSGKAIERQFNINTGKNQLEIRNLTFMKNPQVSAVFNDATGKQYQEHNFLEPDSIIKQTIYDSLGRHTVLTKAAPSSFGNTTVKAAMQFRNTFVNVNDFITNMNTTAILKGDIADYYRGQQDGDGKRSDDQGFPYHRMRYGSSPLKRIVEFGLPGADYAIKDIDTTDMSERKTIQIEYQGIDKIPFNNSTNTAGYYTTALVEPLKGRKVIIKDLEGKKVGNYIMGSDSTDDSEPLSCTLSTTIYHAEGKLERKQFPNYFIDGPQSDMSNYISKTAYNMLGQVILSSEPDTGTTVQIYDSAGNLRFIRPEQDGSLEASFILYKKYDSLNREIETGKCNYQWNEANAAALKQYADDPDWPGIDSNPAMNVTPATSNRYDGDGTDPDKIGLLVSAITFNSSNDSQSKVTEEYTYDKLGKVKKKSITIESAGTTGKKSFELSYLYNNSGQVELIEYPVVQDDEPMTVVYSYDALGRVKAIGESFSNCDSYASYSYDPGDNMSQVNMSAGVIREICNFNSPGWHKTFQYSTTDQEQKFSFNQQYDFDADGRITNIETDTNVDDEQTHFNESFTYDQLKRIEKYVLTNGGESGKDASPLKEIGYTQYDANGNLWTVKDGDEELTLDYTAGTDQLSSICNDEEEANKIVHYPSGEIHKSPKPGAESGEMLTFSYDPSIQRTSSIEDDHSEKVDLIYGSKGRRAAKIVKNSSFVFYIHGNNLDPLAELTQDGMVCRYIYGPTGLIAFKKNEETYFPIKDQNGSIRSVLGSAGNLIAGYNYLPYGALNNSYGPDPSVTRYLYTGQEFDTETGLYNYHARLYNPLLRRFCAQDPARQFPSPYIYAGNNPVMSTDPTGDMSQGAQIGFAVGMGVSTAASIVVGVGLSIVSFGAAAPEAAAAVAAESEVELGFVVTDVSGVMETVANTAAEATAEATAESVSKKLLKSAATKGINILIGAGLTAGTDTISQAINDPDNISGWQILGAGSIGAIGGAAFEFADITLSMTKQAAFKLIIRCSILGFGTMTISSVVSIFNNTENNSEIEDDPSVEDSTSRSSNPSSPCGGTNRQMLHKPVKSAHLRKHLHGGHKKIQLLKN